MVQDSRGAICRFHLTHYYTFIIPSAKLDVISFFDIKDPPYLKRDSHSSVCRDSSYVRIHFGWVFLVSSIHQGATELHPKFDPESPGRSIPVGAFAEVALGRKSSYELRVGLGRYCLLFHRARYEN